MTQTLVLNDYTLMINIQKCQTAISSNFNRCLVVQNVEISDSYERLFRLKPKIAAGFSVLSKKREKIAFFIEPRRVSLKSI